MDDGFDPISAWTTRDALVIVGHSLLVAGEVQDLVTADRKK
jgi:hypothetical protein